MEIIVSKSSDAVKKWRNETKKRMVESMGGKCSICNYNKSIVALEFHHIDPSVKEHALGNVRANPKSWNIIADELRKCILLCSNCHREIHDGSTILPEIYPQFNEIFFQYKKLTEIAGTPCKYCGKIKPPQYKFCSQTCVGSNREKIDWSNYDLIEMNKTMSLVKIAETIGVSDVTVLKKIRRIKMAPSAGLEPTTT